MAKFDIVVKDGTIIDGTGVARTFGDIGIKDGIVERVGSNIPTDGAAKVIDAKGKIVAPGVIDPHTHYDAQIHWDPYCTNSGWHGTTTVAVGNCGFGFMPCRPDARDRYMLMMENTEQVPLGAMREALPWKWESFPDWINYMKSVRKGINLAAYMPLNSLMIYVMGYEAAKTRGATQAERQQMRDMLNEAMDQGAIGFALSHLNEFNSHKDCDGSPMPTDSMQIEDAYYLAEVLRERDQGVIQCLAELPITVCNRNVVEELAKISGRSILHNVITAFDMLPDYHTGIMDWLNSCEERGLNIYSQSLTMRAWNEFNAVDADTLWQGVDPFAEFSRANGAAEKIQLLNNSEYRARAREQYNPDMMVGSGGPVESFILLRAKGQKFAQHEGMLLSDIAEKTNSTPIDVIFDIIADSEGAMADFRTTQATSTDIEKLSAILKHKRVLPGTSDGGAHIKFFSGGHFSTDNIMQMVREENRMSLEEIHFKLSNLPSRVLGLNKRGVLLEGYAADLYIYDFDKLGYNQHAYDVVTDLPDGDWRRVVKAQGVEWNIVNGEVIFQNSECTDALPGRLLGNGGREVDQALANNIQIAAE